MKHTHHGVYVIVNNEIDSEILLIRKRRGPYNGLLDLPGGTPEEDESIEETALRELAEETDVVLANKDLEFLGSIDFTFDYQADGESNRLNHYAKVFRAKVPRTIKISETGDGIDSEGAVWVNPGESQQLSPLTSYALRHFNS